MNTKRLTDMTVGSPIRHIIIFTLPLLIGNLFQQLYNMVDTFVVGKFVGSTAIAAVGACSSMNFLFFSLSSGLAIGIGVIVAQAFGSNDEERIRKTIANAVYVLAGASLTVSVLGILFAPALLRLLQTPDDVIDFSITYMRTTCLGILAIAFYNGVAAILRALGDSRTPLYFLILSSIVNVILDLTFVLACDWGVFGVALATILSQLISAVASLFYAYNKVPYFRLSKTELKPNSAIIWKSFKLGTPIALQNSMIAVSCMALQGVVNSFDSTVIMASFTITARIEQLVQQPYSSLGMALTTYAGQNVGALKYDRVKKGFRQATLLVLCFSLIMLPVMYLLGDNIVSAFIKADEAQASEVLSVASRALRITSLFYFGLGMIYTPRAVLNGCGDTGFAMINGLTEVICRIGFSLILIRIPQLGFWGVWLTNGLTWGTTALVCVIRYWSGKWRRLERA